MTTFDPSLLPEGCAGCGQRVVKHEGRCPICATRAEQARAASRPAVSPGPWPRLRLSGPGAGAVTELRVATVVELGAPIAAARVEPDPTSPEAGLVVTALGEGVRTDGVAVPVGRRAPLARGGRLELPDATSAVVL